MVILGRGGVGVIIRSGHEGVSEVQVTSCVLVMWVCSVPETH